MYLSIEVESIVKPGKAQRKSAMKVFTSRIVAAATGEDTPMSPDSSNKRGQTDTTISFL